MHFSTCLGALLQCLLFYVNIHNFFCMQFTGERSFLHITPPSSSPPKDPSMESEKEPENILNDPDNVDVVGCPILSADQSNAILQNQEIQRL